MATLKEKTRMLCNDLYTTQQAWSLLRRHGNELHLIFVWVSAKMLMILCALILSADLPIPSPPITCFKPSPLIKAPLYDLAAHNHLTTNTSLKMSVLPSLLATHHWVLECQREQPGSSDP